MDREEEQGTDSAIPSMPPIDVLQPLSEAHFGPIHTFQGDTIRMFFPQQPRNKAIQQIS